MPNFFQDFPTGSTVQSSLGLNNSQLSALPTQVLNLPPYANWTDEGWNVRFHGNVYKQPNTSNETLDRLANVFLIDTSIQQLNTTEQDEARNVTAEIFVVQQGNQTVQMNLEPALSKGSSSQSGGSTANQNLTLPYPTTPQGDFDVFLPIANTTGAVLAGNETNEIQRLNVFTNGSDLGNATAYLVPPTGLTVVNDIDDILRVTQIYLPANGILNSFAKPYVPWLNMPEIYANWSKSIPTMHFHYLTTTPEQITRNYMQFIYNYYPDGSFDTRPLNFSDVNATLSIRKYLLDKIFQTFPQRKFILVADTSNSDIMRDYPEMAKQYPGQVQCIFLRNTSATDNDKFPYNTSGFKGLNQSMYMFFIVPDDLKGLDIENGNCYNSSIPQNVTFSEQDELLGIHGNGTVIQRASWLMLVAVMFLSMFFLV